MNKLFKLTPVALFGVLLSSCGSYTVPTFEKTNGVSFVAYACPTQNHFGNPSTVSLEHIQKVKEAGFTHMLALYDGATSADTTDGEANLRKRARQANKEAMVTLDLCQQVGLKYYVRDWNLYGMGRASELSYKQGYNCYEKYKEAMNIIFDDECQYIHHPSYAGNYLFDEPEFDEISSMADVAKAYIEKMEQLNIKTEPYLNLLPAYAGSEILGPNGYEGYLSEYVNKIGNKVGYLSYDSYPFMQSKEGSSVKMLYLYTLYTNALKCKNEGLALRTYVQTKGDFTGLRDLTSTADIRWQVYNDLAFGSQYITYYEYGTKTSEKDVEENGLLNLYDGTYNWTYDVVKTVNAEVHNFEDAICSYKFDDLMIKNKDDDYPNLNFTCVTGTLESHPAVKINSVSEDTILTTMKHKDNNSDAFMLLNYTDPYYNTSDTVTLKFPNAKGLLTYRLGQKVVIDLPVTQEYTFVLGPGEGRFIIPLY